MRRMERGGSGVETAGRANSDGGEIILSTSYGVWSNLESPAPYQDTGDSSGTRGLQRDRVRAENDGGGGYCRAP